MEGREDRSPQCEYAELMEANGKFLKLLQTAVARGKESAPVPSYVPPEIPHRSDFTLHLIDNGPGRETFKDDGAKRKAHAERHDAVGVTVALDRAQAEARYRHAPYTRPRVGRYTLFDLKHDTCRYPTGEAGSHFFCGDDVWQGSYCDYHHGVCYRA